MEWTQVLTILGGNMALFLWATRQARSYYLHLDKKFEDHRKEINSIVKAIQDENKHFHEKMIELAKDKK